MADPPAAPCPGIDALTRQDYQVKLGSLLEEPLRSYYRQENFKILKNGLNFK